MARGSGLGAVIGIGALVGAGVLIWRSRAAFGMTMSPRERTFTEAPSRGSSKFPPLVERWRGPVAHYASGAGLPVDALLEWIRIESGGDTCSTGTSTEAGIFQLNFPDDAKYGATLEGLRSICARSKNQNPADLSWMSEADLDMEVGAGVRKVAAARDVVRHVLGGIWPETSFDFGSSVKQIHALPAVITELVPKIRPTGSWADFRRQVLAFPTDQMGTGLRKYAVAPSHYGLKNRLEDTMRNAEMVGRVWASASV